MIAEAKAGGGPEAPLPRAVIRTTPEDFLVEELPAYAPSGKGEHLFVTFEKRGLTTPDAVRLLARALGVDAGSAGWAGMKDRHAVTTQTVSFSFPMARSIEGIAATIAIPGLTVQGLARHDNKLKPGHLTGNRFTLILRDIAAADADRVEQALLAAGKIGVPNAFGPQRFGRDGDNPARAIAWLAGKERGPRDRREQRLLFSALQSLLFNRVLERRQKDGTWAKVLPGDLAKKHDSGGLFVVPLEGPELADAQSRAEAGLISATGPMFGAKMRWPEGAPAELERAVLAESDLGAKDALSAWKHLGEGTRRSLRLEVSDVTVTRLPGTDPAGSEGGKVGLRVGFVLPKGGYATTVLGQACQVIDAMSRSGASSDAAADARSAPPDEEDPT
ncbi:MAG: tRNA pseudouridine(13) synthase TruD [Byssovorax sp.]